MAISFGTIALKRTNYTGLGSLWVAIALTTLFNKSMPTANLTTAKLLFNSTISTPGASFYGIDLANFYLNTPME